MFRQRMIGRIRYLRNIEIWNIVSIPASLIVAMTQIDIIGWRMMVYNIVVMAFIFLQGAIYWDIKLNSLIQNKASLPDTFRTNFRTLQWFNMLLLLLYPIMTWYGMAVFAPLFETSWWSHSVFLAAVFVHINYYHWQLSHDNPTDLRYLMTHNKLRRSPLNTDLYPWTIIITSPIRHTRRSSVVSSYGTRTATESTITREPAFTAQTRATTSGRSVESRRYQSISTHQSQPIPTHQSQPIPTHQSQPIPTHQSQPISTHQSQPIPTHQSQPIPTHQSQPIPTHQSQPIPTHQSQPIPTHQSQPIPTHQSQPIPTHQSQPIPTHQSQPIPTHQSQPSPTSSAELPSLLSSMETQPLPVIDDEAITKFVNEMLASQAHLRAQIALLSAENGDTVAPQPSQDKPNTHTSDDASITHTSLSSSKNKPTTKQKGHFWLPQRKNSKKQDE